MLADVLKVEGPLTRWSLEEGMGVVRKTRRSCQAVGQKGVDAERRGVCFSPRSTVKVRRAVPAVLASGR